MHLTGIKKDTFLGFESGYDRFPRYSSWIKMISSKYHALFWKLWNGVHSISRIWKANAPEKKNLGQTLVLISLSALTGNVKNPLPFLWLLAKL